MRAVFAILAVLYAATCCARTSIPATASGYSYVDASGIDITGYVFPMRDARNDGTERVMRAEDAACVAEATCQRDVWITGNSQPDSSLYTPAPSNVLQSNIVFAAESFYANKGVRIKARMSIGADDLLRRFIHPEWTCDKPSVVPIDTGYRDWNIGDSSMGAVYDHWAVAALNESLAPSSTVVEVNFDKRPTVSDMTKLYKNVKATKRVFGGAVGSWYSSSTWEPKMAAYLVASSSVYHGYDYQTKADNGWYNNPITRTYSDLWNFYTSCWMKVPDNGEPGGQWSEYSWCDISGAYVVMRPELKDKVESATLYLAVVGNHITSCTYDSSQNEWVANGKYLLAYVKVPLTKAGARTLGGASCDQWSMPQAMDSTKSIFSNLVHNVWGTNRSGFPMITQAGAYSGLLDLVMKPDVEIDDETWNP